MQGFISKLRKI